MLYFLVWLVACDVLPQSSLGQAIESVADSVDKAARDVSKDFTNTVSSPMVKSSIYSLSCQWWL